MILDRGKRDKHIGAFVSEQFYRDVAKMADKERRSISEIIRFALEERLEMTKTSFTSSSRYCPDRRPPTS